MYNPLPYLPKKVQHFITRLKQLNFPSWMVFFTVGILATAWFLIRVVPKPSRVNYPCVQATAPLMSGFVLYLIGLFGSVAAFNRFRYFRLRSRNLIALFFLVGAALFFLWSVIQIPVSSQAKKIMTGTSFFPPNEPIGEAEGIFKGRVVWMWDPSATNENCSNSSNGNGIIDAGDDGWFMSQNNNQTAIDSMVIKSLIGLTGKSDMHEAWDTLFKFYNIKHGHGNVGYSANQKIFIKINATSAYGGLAEGRFNADLGRTDILTINDFVSETNPFVVLSILRQLVNHALVPENMIYVGDPARNVYKEFYNLWHAEFPNIHILGNNLLHSELNITALGRTPVAVTTSDKVFFSDHGTVMPLAISDKLFTIFEEMDYLINIPALKAHGTGGITLAAKNHFGSFTREWAMHLHKGLMDSVDYPLRQGYGLYRVQTDIMMHNLLSGKNLLIIVDGLYPGEDALGVPFRWTSPPFSNDWCSSLMMSLDPVAIESVCHDFLRTEYNGPTYAESRPNWPGVDDYLHQAADSALWPAAITYDPDANGMLIASLGVHEHWNDSLHKQYSRDLGTGPGIELYKAHEIHTGIPDELHGFNIRVYPNPASDFIHIANFEHKSTHYQLINLDGKLLLAGTISPQHDSSVNLNGLKNGIYILRLHNDKRNTSVKIIRNASR